MYGENIAQVKREPDQMLRQSNDIPKMEKRPPSRMHNLLMKLRDNVEQQANFYNCIRMISDSFDPIMPPPEADDVKFDNSILGAFEEIIHKQDVIMQKAELYIRNLQNLVGQTD